MKRIGEQIWVHEDEMALAGVPLALRMTILQLKDGKLWLHSPTKLSSALKQKIDEIGEVSYIVAASNGHNTWLCEWQDAYPESQVYVSAGIPERVQLKSPKILDAASGDVWTDDLHQATMPSVPFFNETVFLHQNSKSLIVTDLIQNHNTTKPQGFSARLAKSMFLLFGFKGKCVAPPLKMGFVRKDKIAFAAFIEQVYAWDFDKIVVTHGEIISEDAKNIFAKLCDRFLIK